MLRIAPGEVLSHPDTVKARATIPAAEEFCAAVEATGPMAALGFLGRPEVMEALQAVLPKVLADVNGAASAAAPVAAASADDNADDIYD